MCDTHSDGFRDESAPVVVEHIRPAKTSCAWETSSSPGADEMNSLLAHFKIVRDAESRIDQRSKGYF
jgi:hypothetical protein